MTILQGQSGVGMVPMHISKPRAANADMNGKRVSRGCIVSWHGLRYQVGLVRTGIFQAYPVNLAGQRIDNAARVLHCVAVQVVTP